MHKKLVIFLLFTSVFCFCHAMLNAQSFEKDTNSALLDTLGSKSGPKKSSESYNVSSDAISDQIDYYAEDSIVLDLDQQKIYLYGTAQVNYTDIQLNADFIEFDMGANQVLAHGLKDSLNKVTGKPVFKKEDETFQAEEITYNFETKRSFVKNVRTEQEGGFLHSEKNKRHENGHVHIKNGKYTTCDAEHPHFYIALTRAIAIPDEKIVSGPAYMVISDVPFYFPVFPFGFFPSSKKRSAGILPPVWGDEVSRGFYLRGLGYYMPINDYVDLAVTGDIYSKGTWGANVTTNYKARYKYNGNLSFDYYNEVTGERGFEDFSERIDYRIRWSHRQDPKANPTQTFSANVNMSSSRYDQDYSRNVDDFLTNQKNSSVAYTKRWTNTPFDAPINLNASMNHSQNNRNNSVSMNLPKFALSTGKIYPFKKKGKTGGELYNYLKDIRLDYTANLDNRYNTTDSLFFENFNNKNFDNGFRHRIPISIPALPKKLYKYAPIRLSMGYEGYGFTKQKKYLWDDLAKENVTDSGTFYTGDFISDTIHGFSYVHRFNYLPTFSGLNINKNLFVILQSTKANSKVNALRYVMMPSASLSYTPGRKGQTPDYYETVYSTDGDQEKFYSIYERSIYQPPGQSQKTSSRGSINFRLNNNIEMKVRNDADTASNAPEFKKVVLLENLTFSSRYNMFADSLNWSRINLNGSTRFFNNALSINANGTMDPYVMDKETGRNVNKFELKENGRFARITNLNFRVGLNKTSNAGRKESVKGLNGESYTYFDVPWSFNVNYDWTYRRNINQRDITQTLRFNGYVKLTENWNVTFRSGYDIKAKDFTTTSIDITRNLHCWEMRARVVPFGTRKFYEFQINVKSSVLRDLKYDFDRDWRDFR